MTAEREPKGYSPTVCFVFGQYLTAQSISGGDVLSEAVARHWRHVFPDHRIAAIAPAIAVPRLSAVFGGDAVFALEEQDLDIDLATRQPWRLLGRYVSRVRPVGALLRRIAPDIVFTTGDFFVNHLPTYQYVGRTRALWVSSVYHLNEPPYKRRNSPLDSTVSFVLQRFSLELSRRRANVTFVLNSAMQQSLRAMGYPSHTVHVGGAGIRIEDFPPAPVHAPGDRLVWVNRMHRTKGIHDVPAILNALRGSATIDFVGVTVPRWTTPMLDDFTRLGLRNRVTVHGFVSREQRYRIMAAADVFFTCSYEEGWGLSVCEALSMGLPVVAYDLPALREVFADVIDLVPVGDVDAFARALRLRLDNPHEGRERRISFARAFDVSAFAEREATIVDHEWRKRSL